MAQGAEGPGVVLGEFHVGPALHRALAGGSNFLHLSLPLDIFLYCGSKLKSVVKLVVIINLTKSLSWHQGPELGI